MNVGFLAIWNLEVEAKVFIQVAEGQEVKSRHRLANGSALQYPYLPFS